MITERDRRKLIRFLGMLGSDHDGEVVNAARIALRLIKDRGLTWDDVLGPGVPEHTIEGKGEAASAPRPPPRPAQKPQPKPQHKHPPAKNPWYFIAAELMNELAKKKRIAATDLQLLTRAQDPFYEPNFAELSRLRDLYIAYFGQAAWAKAS